MVRLRFKGEKFIGMGLVLRGPCEIEVSEARAAFLLNIFKDQFEEVQKYEETKKRKRKEKEEEMEEPLEEGIVEE